VYEKPALFHFSHYLVGRLDGRHHFALKERQHIGIAAHFFLNNWIVFVVAASLEEVSEWERGKSSSITVGKRICKPHQLTDSFPFSADNL